MSLSAGEGWLRHRKGITNNKKQGEAMKSEYLFPTVLIILDVLAAIPYAAKGNMRMMIYWLAAATLTACVTYK
jgi:hypothetical protein